MAERDDSRPASSREVAGEDFLFHLHRGTELLQDNRVHAAKAEIEQALSMQPSDPKGQDLLGIVYFRLGLYPRAIAIYERLIQAHPDAIEPRINLALSYLKTGQPAQARVELEKVLEQNPRHQRAWGYLGLAFQRMGDVERASHAFAAGGHDAMARRLLDVPGPPTAGPAASLRGEAPPPMPQGEATDAELRRAAGEAMHALDGAVAGFRADSDFAGTPSGTWAAIEPGRAGPHGPGSERGAALRDANTPQSERRGSPRLAAMQDPGHLRVDIAAASMPLSGARRPPRDAAEAGPSMMGAASNPGMMASSPGTERSSRSTASRQTTPSMRGAVPSIQGVTSRREPGALDEGIPASRPGGPPTPQPAFGTRAPDNPLTFARERLLVFPRNLPIAQHPTGLVLVQAAKGFATRLEAIRSLTAAPGIPTQPLPRLARGRMLDEMLGGVASPIHELSGRCELVLGPEEGHRLQALSIGDEPLYLREDVLLGFELTIIYENGRLALGDGESIPMVQIRGRGALILSLPERASAIEIVAGRATIAPAVSMLGWLGRLAPRALPASEAPAGLHDFVTFSGEGMVIVDGQ